MPARWMRMRGDIMPAGTGRYRKFPDVPEVPEVPDW